MRIHSLQLKDFRCFEDFNMKFAEDHNVHVILADNMAGKSGIMGALRIMVSTYIADLVAGQKPTIRESDHRVIGNKPSEDRVSNCKIVSTASAFDDKGVEQHYSWFKFKTKPVNEKAKVRWVTSKNLSRSAKAVYDSSIHGKANLPLLSFVGTEYIHSVSADTKKLKAWGFGKALDGYLDCLSDKNIKKPLFNWLRKVDDLLLETQYKKITAEVHGSHPSDAFYAFEFAVRQLLTDIEAIEWSKHKGQPLVKMTNGDVRYFDMLSDGYRYLLLLAGELAMRAILLNKHLGREVFERTTGVVLIDEFGIHLHPSLQTEALKRLSALFPNVQFIISTHSPMLINGLRKEQIHILEVQEDGTRNVRHPDEDAIGIGANGILTEMFGLATTMDSVYEKSAEKFKQLNALKSEGALSPEEEKEYTEVRAVLSRFQMDPAMRISDDPITEAVREKLKEREASRFLKADNTTVDVKAQVDEILNELLSKK